MTALILAISALSALAVCGIVYGIRRRKRTAGEARTDELIRDCRSSSQEGVWGMK